MLTKDSPQEETQSKNNKNLLIFVAGLPANVCMSEVVQFFALLGEVSPVQPRSVRVAEDRRRKGHCVLMCRDRPTFDCILKEGRFKFHGRNITAMPFMTGQALIEQNKEMTEARVIIKKVPAHISESDLRMHLEINFGRLRSLHRFVLDKTKVKADAKKLSFYRRFDSYSAIFESKTVAKLLAEKKTLLIQEKYPVWVEGFIPKKTREGINTQSDSRTTSHCLSHITKLKEFLSLNQERTKKLQYDHRNEILDKDDWIVHLKKPTTRDYFVDDLPFERPHFLTSKLEKFSKSNYMFRVRR